MSTLDSEQDLEQSASLMLSASSMTGIAADLPSMTELTDASSASPADISLPDLIDEEKSFDCQQSPRKDSLAGSLESVNQFFATLSPSSPSSRKSTQSQEHLSTPRKKSPLPLHPSTLASGHDESPSHQCPIAKRSGSHDSGTSSNSNSIVAEAIGPTNLIELAACPCCQQAHLSETTTTVPKTLIEPMLRPRSPAVLNSMQGGNLLRSPPRILSKNTKSLRKTSLLQKSDSFNDEDEEDDDDRDILPGVLAAGVHYNPKRILAEGWLHKKGTGQDWLGNRSWKPRWARLVMATLHTEDSSNDTSACDHVDVPLMLIYWYSYSELPSTVVVLDSTIVLPVDMADKSQWNSYRFEIQHVVKSSKATSSPVPPVTRTFTVPKKGRDAWVYAISQALLTYEKQKDKSKKQANHAAAVAAQIHARVAGIEVQQEQPAYMASPSSPSAGSAFVRPSTTMSSRSVADAFEDVWTSTKKQPHWRPHSPTTPPLVASPPSSPSSNGLRQIRIASPTCPRLPRPSHAKSPQTPLGTKPPSSILAQPRL